jgi:large subunit ribosomal protein L23
MSILDKFKKKNQTEEKASVAKQVVKDDAAKSVKPKKESKAKKPAAKKPEKKEQKAIKIVSKKSTQTLLDPVISEKTAQLSDAGVVVFRVAKGVNRVEVRDAFRELYNVTPVKVNMINMRGHQMRFGRTRGRTKDYRKAMITLPKGVTIDIFEGV